MNVYLDNAATTAVDPRVIAAYLGAEDDADTTVEGVA